MSPWNELPRRLQDGTQLTARKEANEMIKEGPNPAVVGRRCETCWFSVGPIAVRDGAAIDLLNEDS